MEKILVKEMAAVLSSAMASYKDLSAGAELLVPPKISQEYTPGSVNLLIG